MWHLCKHGKLYEKFETEEKQSMAGTDSWWKLCKLNSFTTRHYMAWKGNQHEVDMFMTLSMARESLKGTCITSKTHGKTKNHVNNLPGIVFSKSRARKWHAKLLHNCNQRHEWIEQYHRPRKERKIKEHNTGMTKTKAARVEQNTRHKAEPSTLYQVYRFIN